MEHLPRGTVTFLFTDIEGSTRLWQAHADTMPAAYERHDTILREAVFAHGGIVYKTVGDAFQVAFPDAAAGVGAALDAQRALQAEAWPLLEPLKVRMGLHTGAVDPTIDGDYRSPVLNRLGRLLSAAHGDQVLVSQATMELARDHVPEGAGFIALGEQRLKDLSRPERVFQLSGPALRTDFPPPRTLDARPNNLPTQLTRFIGREDDLAVVKGFVRRDDVRLVTLTGPGGIGKTRLALQAGADALDRFEHGVFVVTLDTVTDPELVPAAIAQTLELRETGETPIDRVLIAFVRDRRMLLVLDNFEQVVEAASFVGDLLRAAPGLKVIATSRLRLQIHGEHEYPVRPFALPDPARAVDVSVLSQYESVRLFIERSEAASPSFSVTSANAPAIAEICTRLDGLPLAIELAAARIKILPPEAMLGRLSARLPILNGGARNMPARQQTLRGAIAWSYELLNGADRELFRRIAVFSGGATLEAVQAVAADEGMTLDAVEDIDGIERLVDHSLLRQVEGAGEPRFAMFETIREFGLEQLEAEGELAAARRRHAAWFTDLIHAYLWEFSLEEMVAWLDQVELEHDNVRAARAWALGNDRPIAFRIMRGLPRFAQWRGAWRENVPIFRQLLSMPADDVDPWDHARVLMWAAGFPDESIGEDQRRSWGEQALSIFRSLGREREASHVLSSLSIAAFGASDRDRWDSLGREAIATARAVGDMRSLALILNNHAFCQYLMGEFECARVLIDEATRLARDDGGIYLPTVLNSAGDIYRAQGELATAAGYYVESLVAVARTRLYGDISSNLIGLIGIAAESGSHERAARLAGVEAALRSGRDITREYNFDKDEILGSYASDVDRVRGTLGADAFKAAWDTGAAMSMDDILAEATTLKLAMRG